MSVIFSKEVLTKMLKCVGLVNCKTLNNFSTVRGSGTGIEEYLRNEDKFRFFTKKEIEKLPFSDSYFEQLEGNYLESPLDSTTNSISESPVLVRNNTGSDLFVLNNEYLGSNSISYLSRELKNLEENIYKRFGVISSVNRKVFSKGLNQVEFAKFNEAYLKLSDSSQSGEWGSKEDLTNYLRNVCNLLYTVKTFKKPLVVYGNGQMESFGANLCFLSDFSSCYSHSSYQLNLSDMYFDSFGSSFVLSTLKSNLGEYLVLTNDKLEGRDLIWAGLVKRFIEPNNINNLQILSDRLVELPEKYVEDYLSEFTVNVESHKRGDLGDGCKIRSFRNVIDFHFKHDRVNEILDSLGNSFTNSHEFKSNRKNNQSEESIRQFESVILDKIKENSNSKNVTKLFNLVKQLKRNRYEVLAELNVSQQEWNKMISLSYKSSRDSQQENAKMLYRQILEFILVKSLNLEITTFFKSLN